MLKNGVRHGILLLVVVAVVMLLLVVVLRLERGWRPSHLAVRRGVCRARRCCVWLFSEAIIGPIWMSGSGLILLFRRLCLLSLVAVSRTRWRPVDALRATRSPE